MLSRSQVKCKICLKSAGLHEFFGWFCVVLFEGSSSLKNASTDGLSGQEKIGQHFLVLGDIDFGDRYDISNLKLIFPTYIFREVCVVERTYEIILTFFATYMVQNKQNNLFT